MITQAIPILSSPFKDTAFNFIQSMGQRFGQNALDYAQFGIKGHNGIDIPKGEGVPIYASHDGRVVRIQESVTQGNGIWILQNIPETWLEREVRFRTSFWHLKGFADLQVGQEVISGQLIGFVDSTGFSTGNHLHWGLCPFDGKGVTKVFPNNGYDGYIDPFKFIKDYSHNPLTEIGGTYDLKPMLRLVLLGSEQYLRDKDGNDYHIYNVGTLNALFSAGIIDTLVPTLVSSVKDIGKEFVVLTRE